MKKALSLVGIVLLIACTSRKENRTAAQNNTPKALQDNKETSLVSFSKRGPGDVVDELYEEKLDELPGLKNLDKKFNDLNESKIDSLAIFHKFDSKNNEYYSSADAQLNRVQDSFLKSELKTFFANNKTAYSNSISRLKGLEEQIDKQYISVIDKRIVLKLFITLNMMNEFRKTNIPSVSSLEAILNNYKTYNGKLDSAIAKNK